ncbi:hypothetical protein [Streptosporangium roseum]|nr:hypothetical protein [Streptosporangium roseum]
MTHPDPAVAWLEQQAARYAAVLDDPALEMQTPTAPAYLRYEQTPETTR